MRVTVAVLIVSGLLVSAMATLRYSSAEAAQNPRARSVVVFEPSPDAGVRAVLRFTFEQAPREYVLEAASIRAENTDKGLEIAAEGGATVTLSTGKQLLLESATLLVAKDGVEPVVSMSGRTRTTPPGGK